MRIPKVASLILLPVILGLFVRMDDYVYWLRYPQKFFANGTLPVLTSMDGYHYALLSKRFSERWRHTGIRVRELISGAGQGLPKIVALASVLFHEPPEKIAVWLAPALASILAFPLLLFGYLLESTAVGVFAATAALMAPIYVSRSTVCWLDTDILNLFFPCIMTLSLFLFSKKNLPIKLVSLAILLLGKIGWKWWYAHEFLFLIWAVGFVLIAFVDLLHSALIVRRKRQMGIVLSALMSLLVLFYSFSWTMQHGKFLERLPIKIQSLLSSYERRGSFKVGQGLLPSSPVSELQKPTFLSLSREVCGNVLSFVLALLGLVFILRKNIFAFMSLVPFVVLGSICVKGGIRFSMYLVPVAAVGIGYFLLMLIHHILLKWQKMTRLVWGLIYALLVLGNYPSIISQAKPVISPATAEAMMRIGEMTPKNAVILTWWDLGYPIQYYAERRTFTDGGNQNPRLIYLTALVFSSSSSEDAKSFAFLMDNPLKQTLFFKRLAQYRDPFPALYSLGKIESSKKRPIYIFLTDYLVGRLPAIYAVGMWNFLVDKGPQYLVLPMSNCKKTPQWVLCDNVKVDLYSYIAYTKGEEIPIKKAVVVDKHKKIYERQGNPFGVVWLVIEAGNRLYSFLMDEAPFRSMFSQLFFMRKAPAGFSLLMDRFPSGVLYEVE